MWIERGRQVGHVEDVLPEAADVLARAEARGKHLGRPALPKRVISEIEAPAISTDLSVRQIQAKIAGQASRGIVGEIISGPRRTITGLVSAFRAYPQPTPD